METLTVIVGYYGWLEQRKLERPDAHFMEEAEVHPSGNVHDEVADALRAGPAGALRRREPTMKMRRTTQADRGSYGPIAWLALVLVGACVPRRAAPPAEGARSTASASVPTTSPLELTIATAQSSYAPGENIVITATIQNHSGSVIATAHPDYWGVSEINVTDGSGRPVTPSSEKVKRKPVASVMIIPPGESRPHAFENLTFYTCCSAESFRGRLVPGRYRVVVTITNPPVRVPLPDGASSWTGTLVSGPVSIEIR